MKAPPCSVKDCKRVRRIKNYSRREGIVYYVVSEPHLREFHSNLSSIDNSFQP